MIYFIIVLLATTIGGIAGMGGGVIIKPALDFMGVDIAVAAVLAAVTVLAMTVVSIVMHSRSKFRIDRDMVLLAAAALVGGVAGNQLFSWAISAWSDAGVNMVQIIVSIVLLVFALLKDVVKKTKFTKPTAFIVAGLLLGAVSTFVGIGGGPINVAVLVVFFGFAVKRAVVASIFIIMAAQFVNVVTMMIQGDMFGYDLTPLWFMVPAAIIGGLVGALLSKKMKDEYVNVIFFTAVSLIILLNVHNLVSVL
ncbi:MAG: sulfite exporter TauE/SafE family protein [Clostridia bacterium]|jgi:uncharacterized protein|nr:sulfite exporter TauE/SafE family protein [Clostridia bacterium]MBT7121491.1 sulfite exporter TauE/SafE family protein [Clostridia bacterium]